jgi:hypothetical protein
LEDRIQVGFKEMCCEKVNCVEVAKNLAVNMSTDLISRVNKTSAEETGLRAYCNKLIE